MSMTIGFTSVTPQEFDRAIGDSEWADELIGSDEKIEQEPNGYLDKSWAGLEYLMHKAEVGFEFLFTGKDITDDGTLFGWSPELVRQTAEELRSVPFGRLAAHYDGPAMQVAEVYPLAWDDDGNALDYVEFYYAQMVAFFEAAAASGAGAIMSFSF